MTVTAASGRTDVMMRMIPWVVLLGWPAAAPGEAPAVTNEAKPAALQNVALEPLPLGSIRPTGWLERQLRIQADGLTGHLDVFWPDIRDSGWIGGSAEGWERAPYWLDGTVPLAYLLDDDALKAKVQRYIDYTLEHQKEDGWLGPEISSSPSGTYQPRDPWPVYVMLKVLTQYHEATGDPRVIPAMQRFLRRLDQEMDARPLFDWNKFRWQDLAVSICWLYDRAPDPELLKLAEKARAQGYDWLAHFQDLPFKERVPKWEFESHVVNNAMAVKTPGVWWRVSGDPAHRDLARGALDELDRYHGQVTGLFTGDECFAGRMPSQGTELCAVVEYMFSLETLTSILGDPVFADRLERIAFNALPATFKADMWAHQYDQQANQVLCRVSEHRVFGTNGPDANLFGLEPNYGCCTANMHQGWPKFAAHLWMKSPDGGLAAVAYAPSVATVQIGDAAVRAELVTNYPFRETLEFRITADRPVRFPLRLRIPAWAAAAELAVEGEAQPTPEPRTFASIDRTWEGTTTVTLRLPAEVRVERRFNNALSILRGPLVYSLNVGTHWRYLRGQKPHADWEVYPTTQWNYALEVDEATAASAIKFETQPVAENPFDPEAPPVKATVPGRLLPEWVLERNAAAPPPPSPVKTEQPLETLTLIPYGCAKLRVTEFPTTR